MVLSMEDAICLRLELTCRLCGKEKPPQAIYISANKNLMVDVYCPFCRVATVIAFALDYIADNVPKELPPKEMSPADLKFLKGLHIGDLGRHG